jgi:hypothetical protein
MRLEPIMETGPMALWCNRDCLRAGKASREHRSRRWRRRFANPDRRSMLSSRMQSPHPRSLQRLDTHRIGAADPTRLLHASAMARMTRSTRGAAFRKASSGPGIENRKR